MTAPKGAATKDVSGGGVACNSCALCKFLYSQDNGYSNYTVEDTTVDCAKDRNPNLPEDRPWDWKFSESSDNWPATNNSRCELYAVGPQVDLDVDGEVHPADCTDDPETIAAVCAHSGIAPRLSEQQS